VEVVGKLGLQHLPVKVTRHARQGDLEVAGEVECRTVILVPAAARISEAIRHVDPDCRSRVFSIL
jgi:hypothetical protein